MQKYVNLQIIKYIDIQPVKVGMQLIVTGIFSLVSNFQCPGVVMNVKNDIVKKMDKQVTDLFTLHVLTITLNCTFNNIPFDQ